MKTLKKLLLLTAAVLCCSGLFAQSNKKIALVIHGGAGVILKKNMTPEKDKAYREKLQEALDAGYAILENGGTSEEAVIASIMVMENSPLFNAGKGAVLTNAGHCELDASIMDGKTLEAGAVAGVTNIKNPVLAAKAVKDNSVHVMLSGKGAEAFAKDEGLELVDPSYFITDRRKQQLEKAKTMDESRGHLGNPEGNNNFKFGTVGAVALDQQGNIVAATSTGGMTNKRFGRIGDSPIIGAGTYANNQTCGISSTGHGEYFIRLAIAHNISAQMEYKGVSLQDASQDVIMKQLTDLGGTGGVIGLDKEGNIMMTFNTPGMFRGFKKVNGETGVFIYNDEE
ncbi:isoaspartyl peptidase/L-asparaginase [Limibacter armeniacum]|uniref:isoaspartyl peptidase/L-asparaginase family protein n=1 Tax=Limibacter armeniacum TaxID=466084 RepID=UPI002FE64EC4